MLDTKLHLALALALLAPACSREGVELCDPADGEVSFEVLGQAADLEGLWVGTDDTDTSRPVDLLFDAGGRPREIHPRGWGEDGNLATRFTFGCDDASYPISFPLVAGETNSRFGNGSLSSAGNWARTLEEVAVEGTQITLMYREFDPGNGFDIKFWRFVFERLESEELAVSISLRFEEDAPWPEHDSAVMAHN